MRDASLSQIPVMSKVLDDEEAADNQMRQQYGQRWSRMPSNSINLGFRQQLKDYQSKGQVASETDKRVEEKFNVHGESLKLLNKTRAELSSLIPQSQDQRDIASNPTIIA